MLGICGEVKKVGVDEAAARVFREGVAEGDQSAEVPIDHGVQRIDDDEGFQRRVFEGGCRCVSEAKTAADDVRAGGFSEGIESEVCEGDFDHVEEAGHEIGVAEFDFEYVKAVELEVSSALKNQISERSLAEIEFFKEFLHGRWEGCSWCGWRQG